jgi:putative flippase GtrA
MLPICYQFRDESLLQMRNNSTIAVGINFLSVLAGTVIGTWVAVPPTQERQEISSIQPILIGVGIGEIIGFILALIVIWKGNNNERSM